MDQQKRALENDPGTLADDARALMSATADAAGDKSSEAHKRLAAALDSSRKVIGRVRDKAVDTAKATDELLRVHTYQAIGVAFGLGALIGYLASRRCSATARLSKQGAEKPREPDRQGSAA